MIKCWVFHHSTKPPSMIQGFTRNTTSYVCHPIYWTPCPKHNVNTGYINTHSYHLDSQWLWPIVWRCYHVACLKILACLVRWTSPLLRSCRAFLTTLGDITQEKGLLPDLGSEMTSFVAKNLCSQWYTAFLLNFHALDVAEMLLKLS